MAISVSIRAGSDRDSSYVQATGTEEHIITDTERTNFKITDGELKDLVNKYFGKRPNDAYLHSPTPWDDLYKRYNWSQTQVKLVVEKAEITDITSEPVIIANKTFENSSDKKGTFNASISDTVTNTISNTWSQSNTVSFSQKIKYEVGFLGTGGGGETSLSYSHTWGESKTESKSVSVGTNSGVTVELDPGQAVKAQLTASRGVMKVRITFKAYLTGCTAINYNPTYKGHHFWCLGITQVMSHSNVSTSRTIVEDMEIGFYSNSKVELLNTDGHMVASQHVDALYAASTDESRTEAA